MLDSINADDFFTMLYPVENPSVADAKFAQTTARRGSSKVVGGGLSRRTFLPTPLLGHKIFGEELIRLLKEPILARFA